MTGIGEEGNRVCIQTGNCLNDDKGSIEDDTPYKSAIDMGAMMVVPMCVMVMCAMVVVVAHVKPLPASRKGGGGLFCL